MDVRSRQARTGEHRFHSNPLRLPEDCDRSRFNPDKWIRDKRRNMTVRSRPLARSNVASTVERASVADEVRAIYRREAHRALSMIDDESREEGFPLCSDGVKNEASTLVDLLVQHFPRRYEVYPTDHGEIAIEAPSGPRRGVLIVLNGTGGASCFVTYDGKNRRATYDDAGCLPDAFVIEAMRSL